jgi:hypothetical protein
MRRELVAETLDVLTRVRSKSLGDASWARVSRVLDDLESALAGGDKAAVERCVEALWATRRATRVGHVDPARPPTPGEDERINTLIHRIGGLAAGEVRSPNDGEEQKDDGRGSGHSRH